MSVALQFKLTQTGQAAVWNANNTGTSLNLTHIQFGSGNRAPSGTETALLSPQQAVAIAAGFSVSSTQIRMSAIFTGNQNYVVREVGLWAGDPAVVGSKLVGYWSQAAGDLAMKSPGVDFIFSHDMTLDAAVPAGSLTILADNAQSAMLAMIAAHEAKANPHPQYATKAAVQEQTYTAFTTAGAAPSFTLTASPAIAAYAAGQRFRVKFGAAGNGADTLNVNALGAKSLKQYDAGGTKVAPVIAANQLVDVEFDGVDFVILDPLSPSRGCQQFTANGNFTVPAGVTKIYVSGCAGGGGGGGSGSGNGTWMGGAGGGGAGQSTMRQQFAVTPGQVLAVVVGAGGAGGTGGAANAAGSIGNSGSGGGNTTIAALGLVLTGGGGGGGSNIGSAWGNDNGPGGGGSGYPAGTVGWSGPNSTVCYPGGLGGSTPFGGAGGTIDWSWAGGVSVAGGGYGSGGGGGFAQCANAPGIAGANGAPGIIIIEW